MSNVHCEQSTLGLCLSKSLNGTTEISTSKRQLLGRAALEAAKSKTTAKLPTLRSQVDITGSTGQGRATKECELIWCPVFDSSTSGMLVLRMFVGKVHF